MELVHCICGCVHDVLDGNIPVSDIKKERLERHGECLRKLVNKKTSYRERKQLIQEGGFLGSLIPKLVGLVGNCSLENNGRNEEAAYDGFKILLID